MKTNLNKIKKLNNDLEKRFQDKLIINQDLKRTLVSFQANKNISKYRWFKFKEGYSSTLVEYILSKLKIKSGKIIDPFAGSGTSLFASAEKGFDSIGIELLPIAKEIMEVRKFFLENTGDTYIIQLLEEWLEKKPWITEKNEKEINHLKITEGAFPKETEKLLGKFLKAIDKVKNDNYRKVLRFALLCILEEISFTRKDGQYLRWDHRSGRNSKTNFNKGEINDFNSAISQKISDILSDIKGENTLFDSINQHKKIGKIDILSGSCLSILPTLKSNQFDFMMTSPPYCNRYDYTRTYALELALLGIDEEGIKKLRQTMMSCTVENKEKENLDSIFSKKTFDEADRAFGRQEILQEILEYLTQEKVSGKLNNSGIVRMVKNYFYEMALVIFECSRILKNGAPFVMVNDNVRYAGANIPVDLILSDFAQSAGFEVKGIWVLPTGKGNSSQQMGEHGREELRKCVYVWQKPTKTATSQLNRSTDSLRSDSQHKTIYPPLVV